MVAEVDGGAAMVLSVDAEAILLAFLAAEGVREDMLREARKGAGGEKLRGGAHGAGGKGRLFSHERLSHARYCCSHTIFVQFFQNRSILLRGEGEI